MKDGEENKFYSDKENCNLMEHTWKDFLTITGEENWFNKNHSDHKDINVNIKKLKPFPTAKNKRLNTDNYHTKFGGNKNVL